METDYTKEIRKWRLIIQKKLENGDTDLCIKRN